MADTDTKANKSTTKKTAKFSKEKILSSASYKDKKDLIAALLTDGKEYTKEDVNRFLDDYLKREVR